MRLGDLFASYDGVDSERLLEDLVALRWGDKACFCTTGSLKRAVLGLRTGKGVGVSTAAIVEQRPRQRQASVKRSAA